MEQGSDIKENSGRSNSEEDRDMEVEVHTGMAARFEEGLTTLEDDYEDSLYEDSDEDYLEEEKEEMEEEESLNDD